MLSRRVDSRRTLDVAIFEEFFFYRVHYALETSTPVLNRVGRDQYKDASICFTYRWIDKSRSIDFDPSPVSAARRLVHGKTRASDREGL